MTYWMERTFVTELRDAHIVEAIGYTPLLIPMEQTFPS